MPTYEWLARSWRDFDSMTTDEQAQFVAAIREFVEDIGGHKSFRKGLGVKGVQGARGIFEMTWAPHGRATFEYGQAVLEGEAHIIWRRVGSHAVLNEP